MRFWPLEAESGEASVTDVADEHGPGALVFVRTAVLSCTLCASLRRSLASPRSLHPYRRALACSWSQGLTDRKLKRQLDQANRTRNTAAVRASRNEILLAEEPGFVEAEGIERTYHFKQEEIAKAVDLGSASKVRVASIPA